MWNTGNGLKTEGKLMAKKKKEYVGNVFHWLLYSDDKQCWASGRSFSAFTENEKSSSLQVGWEYKPVWVRFPL